MTDNNERSSSSLSGVTVANNDSSRPGSARSGATLEGEALKIHGFRGSQARYEEATIDLKAMLWVCVITDGVENPSKMEGWKIFRGEAGEGEWNVERKDNVDVYTYVSTREIAESEWDSAVPRGERRLYEGKDYVWRVKKETGQEEEGE